MTAPRTPSGADDEPAEPLDDLARQATRWVIRLTSGDATSEDIDSYRRWRDGCPEHAAALDEARRHWLALGPVLERAPGTDRASPSDRPSS